MKELGIRNKNERTRNVIRKTWNNDQHRKIHPTGLLSKEQKMQTYICALCKNRLSYFTWIWNKTIVNNRNIKQVKKTKQLLGKLYACLLGTILQFW